jgi:aminoglycoside phosphotransferase family enzyme/predicted kinase
MTAARANTIRRPACVQALLDPSAYPHRVPRIELIETHISWVFLAGTRVYKLKKPVDLGFLDFTTLARRRFFCEEEVRLNRRLAPDVYLGVVEIKRSAGGIHIGGHGRTLEVAVAMRRLPARRMLDRLVTADAVDPELMDHVGIVVSRFHAAAETGGEIDTLGGLDTVRRNWRENFEQTHEFPPTVLTRGVRGALEEYVEAFIARESPRFGARVAAGRCRDCHGDLQAQHVCCTDPIRIFDCIEFNHRFRFGDTAAEIAFLAMDLDRLGRPDLANRFLNAYLEESGDYEAVPLLDFYSAYRAYVRGKVIGFQLAARPELAREARVFFDLAARYAKRRSTPRLLVMTGVMGVGKSTVARALAERIGAIIVRTDAVRKRLAGLPLRERATSEFGEGLYSAEMGRRTYAEALRVAGGLLAAQWNVVVDGTFSSSSERQVAADTASRYGVPFHIVWCDAADAVIATRLRRRTRDRLEVSDGRVGLLAAHRLRYEAPRRESSVVRVDAVRDPAASAERVLKVIGALAGARGGTS